MIASLSLILLCQLAGEVAVRGLGLPMPEPVIGLVLLLLLLRDRFALRARGPLQLPPWRLTRTYIRVFL
jgi:holin-like protein